MPQDGRQANGDEQTSDEKLSGPEVDRRTTLTLLSTMGITGLAGCAGGGGQSGDTASPGGGGDGSTDSPTATPAERYGGRLSAAWNIGEMNQLDPHLANLGLEGQVIGNVFNSLVTTTPNLQIVGDWATDWEVENAQKFTFQLREGVQVHGGYGELTAEDVRYTVDRALNIEGSLAKSDFQPLKPISEGGVRVIDDYTVELNFREPFAPGLASVGTQSIVPKAAAEDMSRSEYKNAPAGAGPFKITEHQLGQRITLDRFEDYYGTDDDGNQLPYLDGVDIDPIPETATLISALESGQVDFANEVPAENVSRVRQASGVSVASPAAAGWIGIQINTLREPFDQPKVRRAMAKTVDKQAFIDQAFFGEAVKARGPIAPVHETYYREDKPAFQAHEPEQARQLLEEAGAMNTPVNLITTERDLRTARVMKNQLDDHFDVSIESLPSSTFWDRENRNYDIAVTGAAPDITVDGPMYYFFRPNPDDQETDAGGGTFNDMWYNDEEVTQLLAEQRTVLDPEQRKEILWNAEDKIMREAPVAFTHHEIPFQATRNNVKGYEPHISLRDFSTVYLDG